MPSGSGGTTFEPSVFHHPTEFDTQVTRRVLARAPTRIDLGGGWTDVPPYCDREGGYVCNIAITRYATAALGARQAGGVAPPLVAAALRRAGLALDAELASDFPVGSGLGGSSAATAAVLVAIAAWKGEPWDPAAIAEMGRVIEVEDLGIAGGRQDHYAAAFGGALGLTFTADTAVRRIPLSSGVKAELPARSMLVYTGESRISGDTITAVLGAYERKDRAVTKALARMKQLARDMAVVLERGDLDALAEMLAEHWRFQRELHPSIPTARIDEIVARSARLGAGAKAMGASGGGCVLVIGRPDRMPKLRESLRELGELVEFGIDETGVAVVEDRA